MTLQNKLVNLPGNSIFEIAIRYGAKVNLPACQKMILDQASDNKYLVIKIIGENLLSEIENNEEITISEILIS